MAKKKLKVYGDFCFTNLLKALLKHTVSLHMKSGDGFCGKVVEVIDALEPSYVVIEGDDADYYICVEDISGVQVGHGELE